MLKTPQSCQVFLDIFCVSFYKRAERGYYEKTTMTHTECYTAAGKAVGISRSKAKEFMDAYIEGMISTVMDDQKPFRIEEVFAITPKVKDAHESKNPLTKQVVQVPRKLRGKITAKKRLERVLD